jgi:hypothetical protein
MSYETPIGSSPAELEYVSLKKDAPTTRKVKAPRQHKQLNELNPHGRVQIPNQLFRQLKGASPVFPPPAPVDPVLEEKKRNRAARFGLPIPLPVESAPVSHDELNVAPRGKKRNTGGIIAADLIDEDVSLSSWLLTAITLNLLSQADKKKARELRFHTSASAGSTDTGLQDLQEKFDLLASSSSPSLLVIEIVC